MISFASGIHRARNPQGKARELGRQQSILPYSLSPNLNFIMVAVHFSRPTIAVSQVKHVVFSNSHLLGSSSHMHTYNTRKVDRIVSVKEKA